MGLSDDQKAILRLLAQRGAGGYEDLAALIGTDPAGVHARAREAAAQLEAEGIPAPEIPPLPGGESAAPAESKPVTPAESKPVTPARSQPVAPPPSAPVDPPQPVAPPSPPEPAPEASAPKSPPAPQPPAARPSRSRPSLPAGGAARAALAAGAAVIVLVIAILALNGGDDSGSGGSGADATTTGSEQNAANGTTDPKLTQAVLAPVDGGDARGLATFGRVKNRLALQVEAAGLEPTGKGESYTIWLYESADKMLPLASTAVGENGRIGAQVEVPTEVLGYLANETFDQIDVSLTENTTLKASLQKATSEKSAPLYTGTDVLRGPISGPIIGAAKAAEDK